MTALVMEMVEGPTLADRIREGPIPIEETRSIAKQIAGALESAHEHGIIHRDLKLPSRPMLTCRTARQLGSIAVSTGSWNDTSIRARSRLSCTVFFVSRTLV